MIRPVGRGAGKEQPVTPREILAAPDYASFREALAGFDCQLCPLHEGRSRLVIDRGHPGASLVLVGEGPGAEEDRQGRAFVGRSGRLLDEMLRAAGLSPEEDVLIVNIVKCRPPGNRAPARGEVDRCLPYLRQQIRLVDPVLVALLGATAVRYLLPTQKNRAMRELVGRLFRSDGFPQVEFLVTFHPAFILRNRTRRGEMEEHLRRLAGYRVRRS